MQQQADIDVGVSAVRASDKKNMLGFHIDEVLESNSGAWRTKLKGIYR